MHGELATGDVRQRATDAGRHQDPVREAGTLLDGAEHVARGDDGAGGERGTEGPPLPGSRVGTLAPAVRKSPLCAARAARGAEAVEDAAEEAGAQLDLEGAAARAHRLADLEAVGLLVDLEGGAVACQADHLAEKTAAADGGELVEAHARERGRLDQRAGDAADDGGRGHVSLTR